MLVIYVPSQMKLPHLRNKLAMGQLHQHTLPHKTSYKTALLKQNVSHKSFSASVVL